MQLLFIRHGESLDNKNNIVSTLDTPLTSRGREQARNIGSGLIDDNIKTIICSPLLRARQTAEIIACELGIARDNITIIDELQERRFGESAGYPKRYDSNYYYVNDALHGFESRHDLICRMMKALSKIRLALADVKEGNAVVVGHCVSGFYLLQVANGHETFDDFDPVYHMNNLSVHEFYIH